MKLFFTLFVLAMPSCFALPMDELISIAQESLAQETTRTISTKNPAECRAVVQKRMDLFLREYLKKHKFVEDQLPAGLLKDLAQATTAMSKALVQEARGLVITDGAVQRALAKALACILTPKTKYIDITHVQKHIDDDIDGFCKKLGVCLSKCSPAMQAAMKDYKENAAACVLARLGRGKKSYTTDHDIARMSEAQHQLVLRQLWADIQMQAHKQTLAHLKAKYANSSAYVRPAEAQKLDAIADKIRPLIKDF